VITDGTPEPSYDRDPELFYHPTTWPGARIPHTWLTRGSDTVSTLDVVGKGRFTLLTGIGGEAWVKAAQSVAEQLGVPIEPFVIGSGRELENLYGDWARVREIADNGCLLVRPDAHIAYRASELPADPTEALQSAVSQLLGRIA
jgi:2,4-dichlorophenol 6-monooxygenase